MSSQYDHQLFLNTVEGPGGDAVVLRLKHPVTGEDTGRGLALTTDGNHRWCALDPHQGTVMTLAESLMNLACVGARPIAVVNCLNFGNPEHPEVMWQLSQAVDGLGDACRAFGLPVIGGNVSLYNESKGVNIDPTPVVGVLGVVDDLHRRPPGVTLNEGDVLVLLGDDLTHTDPSLAGSATAWSTHQKGGALPVFDAAPPQPGGRPGAHLGRRRLAGWRSRPLHGRPRRRPGRDGRPVRCRHRRRRDPRHLPPVRRAALACRGGGRPRAPRRGARRSGPSEVVAVVLGGAGGDRFHIGTTHPDGAPLIDLDLAEVTTSWRDRLPEALGTGTTQA